jgi:hypothetical protein
MFFYIITIKIIKYYIFFMAITIKNSMILYFVWFTPKIQQVIRWSGIQVFCFVPYRASIFLDLIY